MVSGQTPVTAEMGTDLEPFSLPPSSQEAIEPASLRPFLKGPRSCQMCHTLSKRYLTSPIVSLSIKTWGAYL